MYLSLYHEHFGVRYAPRGLASWIFYIICLLITLVIPFIIGLAMENFWVQTNYFYQMPSVTFTERCALRVTTVLGKEYLWTCSDLLNSQIHGSELQLTPFFSLYAEDKDGDGKADVMNFLLNFPLGEMTDTSIYTGDSTTVSVPAPASARDAVLEVSFLPEFIYHIRHYLVSVNMTAAPLLHYQRSALQSSSSGTWSSAPVCVVTKADMIFHTTESLINSPYVSYQHTYTASPLEERVTQPADLVNLAHFAGHYASRNQSVVLRPYMESAGGLDLLQADGTAVRGLWEDLDDLNAFTWSVQLRIPRAEVQYVPSYAEVLKWGWIQYFIVAYIIQWFLWKVRMLLVKLGLINSRATFSVMRRQF